MNQSNEGPAPGVGAARSGGLNGDVARPISERLLAAREEEREAVAQELHDGLAQYLMAAQAHLEMFRLASGRGNAERAARELDSGLRSVKQSVLETRRLLAALRLPPLEELGLVGALERLVAEEKARAGWEAADLEHGVPAEPFGWAMETAVYRSAQEALALARRCTGASQVRLSLRLEEDALTGPVLVMAMRAWSAGGTPVEVAQESGALNLNRIQERVSLIGGNVDLEPAPEEGRVLQLRLSVVRSTPAAREGEAGE